MATLPEVDLGQAEAPPMPSVGWHPVILTDQEFYKNESSGKESIKLTFQFADDDKEAPGYKIGNAYVSWPVAEDYNECYADGQKKAVKKLFWLKKILSAFGGPETGKVKTTVFHKYVGKKVMANIVHEEYNGELQARIDLNFGNGIKPV